MPLGTQQLTAQKDLFYVPAEELARRILKDEYAPDVILPGEVELGNQFGVGRIAVREAVKTLAAKGIVLPYPCIGTHVVSQMSWNPLDQELLTRWMTENSFPQVIKHFLVMRISLEPQAYLLTATIGTAEQKTHLNTLMEKMVELRRSFRRERWIEADIVWHEYIYGMGANPFLTSFASLFRSVYQTYSTFITYNDVVKLNLHQATAGATDDNDGDRALATCQASPIVPNVLPDR